MIWKIEVVWERGKSKKHTETVDSFQLFLQKKTNQLNAVSSCASVKFLSLFLRQTMKLKHKFPYFAQFFNEELTRSLPQNPPNFIRKGKTMRKQLFTSLILEISFDSLSLCSRRQVLRSSSENSSLNYFPVATTTTPVP